MPDLYDKNKIPADLQKYFVRAELGLEETPEAYVDRLVGIFREVRRVLRDDGTLWLNLGDSYQGSASTGAEGKETAYTGARRLPTKAGVGLKPKDLVGIPWRVAFALQADGWYLRSDIIWAKPNPMPESVTDRPTKAHEYIFLLSKNQRYYYDAEAVKEEAKDGARAFNGQVGGSGSRNDDGRNNSLPVDSRNRRSVWTVATRPYKGAHFAVFPPELIEPCVLAGAPKDVCAACGAPHERKIELGDVQSTGGSVNNRRNGHTDFKGSTMNSGTFTQREHITTGFTPTCACDEGTMPGTVLDPFGGSGTTGLVAQRAGRRAVLIEISAEYIELQRQRLQQYRLAL